MAATPLFVNNDLFEANMGIRFKCHHCQAPLNIKSELANKRGVCPHCHGKFRIPSNSQELSLSLPDVDQPSTLPLSKAKSMKPTAADRNIEPVVVSQVTTSTASADTPRNEPTATEELYFVRPPSGGEYGPASTATIELWISQRRLTAETLVCKVGSSKWVKAREVFSRFFVFD